MSPTPNYNPNKILANAHNTTQDDGTFWAMQPDPHVEAQIRTNKYLRTNMSIPLNFELENCKIPESVNITLQLFYEVNVH